MLKRHSVPIGIESITSLPVVLRRLYREIATLAGVENPYKRADEIMEKYNRVSLETLNVEELLEGLKRK